MRSGFKIGFMVDHIIKFILIDSFIVSKRQILVFGIFAFFGYFIARIFKHVNKLRELTVDRRTPQAPHS